ncbi:unnamed protein product [Rhizophagus irregularis]|nr:unnamed protein product [Rhizophagus irregularis]
MQLSRVHVDGHRPKGVATSGGAQTVGYQISAERGRKSRWCTNDRISDIGRKGSLVTVVHKRQDTRYRPKGVATNGGAQTVGRRSTITTESVTIKDMIGSRACHQFRKQRWCTNGRTKANNHHRVDDNEKT